MFLIFPLLALILYPFRLAKRLGSRFIPIRLICRLILMPIRLVRRLVARVRGLTPRDLWVRALRSGRYKQTTGSLCTHEGYCCLGVACDVYRKYHGDLVVDKLVSHRNKANFEMSYGGCEGLMPYKVGKWLDLEEDGRTVSGHSLTKLNDDERKTFDEIADIIENGATDYKGFVAYNPLTYDDSPESLADNEDDDE
jgi:hypothetical protein